MGSVDVGLEFMVSDHLNEIQAQELEMEQVVGIEYGGEVLANFLNGVGYTALKNQEFDLSPFSDSGVSGSYTRIDVWLCHGCGCFIGGFL